MTLHDTYDPSNIFAQILRGEMPAVKVYEDDVALAFMDVFPQSEGHTLVIPKDVTARNLLDMPPEKLAPYMLTVQKVAKAVEAAHRRPGPRPPRQRRHGRHGRSGETGGENSGGAVRDTAVQLIAIDSPKGDRKSQVSE